MFWLILIFGFLGAIYLGMPILVFYYAGQFDAVCEVFDRRWFLRWFLRGVIAPIVLWVLGNLGSMPLMPPLTAVIGKLRASGLTWQALWVQVMLAAFIILSTWGAVSFCWFMARLIKDAKNRDDIVIWSLVWSPVLLPVLGLLCTIFGWNGLSFGILIWIWPLGQYCLAHADFRKPAPTYSQAIAKINRGKYNEAELSIIGQLEKRENDFEGWMRLAGLYANQFHDIATAEQAIFDLCMEPETSLSQISVALHKLADWQINIYGNVGAARRALEDICARMPGTHLATMARHRINQLPAADRISTTAPAAKVALTHVPEDFGESLPENVEVMDQNAAMEQANLCVQKLTADPNDVPAREKLASIYANHLGQVDLAVEQLQLLVEMAGQQPKQCARWLGLMAGWITKHRGEGPAVKNILEKLVSEYPRSPQAFEAQRRLSLMKESERVQRAAAGESRSRRQDDEAAE